MLLPLREDRGDPQRREGLVLAGGASPDAVPLLRAFDSLVSEKRPTNHTCGATGGVSYGWGMGQSVCSRSK